MKIKNTKKNQILLVLYKKQTDKTFVSKLPPYTIGKKASLGEGLSTQDLTTLVDTHYSFVHGLMKEAYDEGLVERNDEKMYRLTAEGVKFVKALQKVLESE